MARLIADAPPLKAAVDTNDPPTVQDVVDDFPAQLNSNLLLVTNRTGQVLGNGRRFAGAAAISLASQPAVRDAAPERETTSLLPQPDGMLQLVTVPIVLQSRGVDTPEILGTLSVGFLLDEALAAQLKEITGSEIAFGMDGQILATTLPRGRPPGAGRSAPPRRGCAQRDAAGPRSTWRCRCRSRRHRRRATWPRRRSR